MKSPEPVKATTKTTDAEKPPAKKTGPEATKMTEPEKPASQMAGLEGSTTKMTPSENSRLMEKRRRVESRKEKKRVNRLILGIILGFLQALFTIVIIIFIWYLLDCQKNLIERVKIQQTELDELRRCTLLKVEFKATFSDSQAGGRDCYNNTGLHVTVYNDQTAVFGEVLENTGGGYSPATGYFTAPVPGLYSFQIHVVGYRTSGACLELRKDGQVKDYRPVRAVVTAGGNVDDVGAGSNSAVVQMEAGDKLWAATCQDSRFGAGGGADAAYGRSTTFSGHLVTPTNCATTSSKASSDTSETSKAGRVEGFLRVLSTVLECCGALLCSRVLQPLMG